MLGADPCLRQLDDRRRANVDEGHVVAVERRVVVAVEAQPLGRERVVGGRELVCNLRVADDLVQRDFNPPAPDRLWVSDIKYVSTWRVRSTSPR